jgi:LAS superfamily LD-carboxypeptidase LdcB
MKGSHTFLLIISSVLLVGFFIFFAGFWRFFTLQELTEAQRSFGYTVENLKSEIKKNRDLESQLSASRMENIKLVNTLTSEQEKNNFFENQINSIRGTVNTLEKLSKTDKELLQKYSKVYFLNENYVPSNLTKIDMKYQYAKNEDLYIHTNVAPFLFRLLDSASANGVPMEIISAYRSFDTQKSLKTGYKILYGTGANAFSADQGYSEHQLGTTLDFTTPELGAGFTRFETTRAYTWMQENAHRYGFILSYPKQNQYYQFEPWHWRFVGVGLATKLYETKQYFYDLDQRVIDTYLISIFD